MMRLSQQSNSKCRRNTCALLFLLASIALSPLASAAGEWSNEYNRAGLIGRVFGVGTYNGELYAAGDGLGLSRDGQPFRGVARFDGTHWQPLGSGTFGSCVNFGLCRKVDTFIEFNGELIVGGGFYAAGGLNIEGVARWDGTQWLDMGLGLGLHQTFGGTVFKFAVFQGELYAAGDFTIETPSTGQEIYGIARWDGNQWQDVGGSFDPLATLAHARALHATPTKLYMGGSFDDVGGVAANSIAAWDGTTWSPLSSGTSGLVEALDWYQGGLVAGGYFFDMGGVPALKLAKWDGTTWSTMGSGVPETGVGTFVADFQVIGTDLYLGGGFHSSDGVSSRSVIRYDGSQYHSVGGIWGSGIVTAAWDLTEWNGKLIVGGEFSRASSVYPEVVGQGIASDSIAAYDGTQWSTLGQGLGFDAGARKALHYNGGIVVVGNFIEAGGSHVQGIAFFNGTEWESLGNAGGASLVNDAIVFGGDLVITGSFSSVGGVPASGIARWDGTQWNSMGSAGGWTLAEYQGELYAGGTGPPMKWNGTTWQTFGTPFYGNTNDMHAHNGVLYIGGSFSNFSGPGPNLVAWDGTTTTSLGATGGTVDVITTFQNELLVGGHFNNLVGVPVAHLGRFDGTTWSQFESGITGTFVSGLEVLRGELYASGDLIQFGGDARDYLAKWDGTDWTALEGGPDGTLTGMLADDATGSLYVAGAIHACDGKPSFYFGRWDIDPGGTTTDFCTGDGGDQAGCTDCPCGNNAAAGVVGGCINGAGTSARLVHTGSRSVSLPSGSTNDLRFSLAGAPPNAFCILNSGDELAPNDPVNPCFGMNSGVQAVAFDGLRCAVANTRRHGGRSADANGDVGQTNNPWGGEGGPPAGIAQAGVGFVAGQTRYFQVVNRDDPLAVCTRGLNTSQATKVTFTP